MKSQIRERQKNYLIGRRETSPSRSHEILDLLDQRWSGGSIGAHLHRILRMRDSFVRRAPFFPAFFLPSFLHRFHLFCGLLIMAYDDFDAMIEDDSWLKDSPPPSSSSLANHVSKLHHNK